MRKKNQFPQHPGFKHNAKIQTDIHQKAFLKATRDIPAGEEIFIDYGFEYWDFFYKDHLKSNPLWIAVIIFMMKYRCDQGWVNFEVDIAAKLRDIVLKSLFSLNLSLFSLIEPRNFVSCTFAGQTVCPLPKKSLLYVVPSLIYMYWTAADPLAFRPSSILLWPF